MKNFFTAFCDNRSSLFIQQCPNLCIRPFTLPSDPFLNRPPSLTDHSFGLSDKKKLTLCTFQVSDVTGKLIILASHLHRFPCSIDHNCKEFRKLVVVDVGIVGVGSHVVQGVLEVDIAGGSEVQLIGVCDLHSLGLKTCFGCDIARGSSMEFSSNTMVRIRKRWKKDLKEERNGVKTTLKNKCACR